MIIDGGKIAAEILEEVSLMVKELPLPPRLTVFTCAPNFETKKFLTLKQKRAAEVGILVTVVEFPPAVELSEIQSAITATHLTSDGIIVQLPFPPQIPIQHVLDKISPTHDVDALFYAGIGEEILPPVVGAIDVIAQRQRIIFKDKQVVVVGYGRLVGSPAKLYAESKGANVKVIQKDTAGAKDIIGNADILILGAGVPGLITPDIIKDSVVIFDAGASEEGGILVGDAVPEVASKASLLTPVPGGIGPITIAVLLRNLIVLIKQS